MTMTFGAPRWNGRFAGREVDSVAVNEIELSAEDSSISEFI
jgi:hypothetical protein